MSDDVIRLMKALFLPGNGSSLEAPWCPAADVYRTPEGWAIKFELAGVRAEDIDLEVSGRTLLLRATRRDCAPQGSQVYQMEIAYSRFQRTMNLPYDLDKVDIHTSYRDGMLLVTIQKRRGQP